MGFLDNLQKRLDDAAKGAAHIYGGAVDVFDKIERKPENIGVRIDLIQDKWPKLPPDAGVHWTNNGKFELDVVGESNYQEGLLDLVDWHYEGDPDDEWVDFKVPAFLAPEPDNEYDPNALAVMLLEVKVGYIPRDIAARIAPVVQQFMNKNRLVIGGVAKVRGNYETPSLGVKLDIHMPA